MADEDEFTDEQWQMVREGILAPPRPRRFKTRDEFSTEEELAYQQGRREPIETSAYQRANSRRSAQPACSADEGEPSTDDYLRKIQARGGRPHHRDACLPGRALPVP